LRDEQERSRIERELIRQSGGADPFAAAVRATRTPMLITDPNRRDNPIVFANAAFSKLTGFTHDEVIGRNCRFLQGPDTDKSEVRRLREAIEEREPIELELLNYKKDGEAFWNRLLVSPVFDADGRASYFLASQFDVTLERERLVQLQRDRDELRAEIGQTTADLLLAEQHLRIALKAAQMGSWSFDLATKRMIASDGCKENFGRPVDEPFTYEDLEAAVHVEDRARRNDELRLAIERTGDFNSEYRIHTPSGDERWVAVRGQVFRRADGTPLKIVGVSQDITTRKRDEEHRRLLASELSHRVKNMLATLQAVVTQTLRNASSLNDASDTLSARIQSMAAANDLLVNEQWEGASIADLVDRALSPFSSAVERIRKGGTDIRVPSQTAVGLSLALHELATNAVKYGALSTQNGHVDIRWRRVEEGKAFRLDWAEVGGPPVAPPTRVGFGSKLIERVLSNEIGATVKLEYSPAGVTFSAIASIADLEEPPASRISN
jgi:PAS domain S-box-containing protein